MTQRKCFCLSFEKLNSIVCWDINTKELANGTEITDIANKIRVLNIAAPENISDYTHYFLDDKRNSRKVEVFVLKYYLKEKYGIEFNPRNDTSTI